MEIEQTFSGLDDKMDQEQGSMERPPEVWRRAPKWIPSYLENERDDKSFLEEERTSTKNQAAKTIDITTDGEEEDESTQAKGMPEPPIQGKQEEIVEFKAKELEQASFTEMQGDKEG